MKAEPQRAEPSLLDLLHGIVNDVKELLVEGVTLTKLEVQDELRKAKIAAIEVAIGVSVIASGGILLMLMLVQLLDAFTEIPLWGCYGIVGAALIVLGGALLIAGKRTAAD